MLKTFKSLLTNATVVGSLALVGCGAPMTATDAGTGAGCPAGCPAADAGCPAGCPTTMGDAQTPPMNTDPVISAWLAGGAYKAWKCEPAGHAPVGNSPHGRNRICNNTALSSTASGDYPVGAASVKELLVADGGTAIVGYAIGLKTVAGPSTGASWYWYLKGGDGMVKINGKGKAANDDGCSSCHKSAAPGRDFVFTQVP
ncbi:MAG: hypothetical protein Q8S33_00530 [Myxococcales bacterium]|nr:hypothetical protein [Myxococcales bacterium]MDP3498777.1 hypothetical protein [Myxococcales bacterium]